MQRRRSRRRIKKTKKHLYKHCWKRAWSRYELDLTREIYDKFNRWIQCKEENKVKFLRKESNSRTHWLIKDIYIVVYDKNVGAIATFLPPEAIWEHV